MFGAPALRRLAWLKFKGAVRRQGRRLRTWRGALFTGMGVLLFLLWVAGVAYSSTLRERVDLGVERLVPLVALTALALTVISFSSALAFRGLFLPREEIERLFSAPVSRADLIRYRLLVNTGRSFFGAVLLGAFSSWRMPRPGLAFLGVLLGMLTLPVFHQMVAILFGGLESRFSARLKSLSQKLFVAAIVGFALLIAVFVMGDDLRELPWVERLTERVFEASNGDPLRLTPVRLVLGPFLPWAHMVTAPDLASFARWGGLCLVLYAALWQLTVRLPIDYRELSMETSASVARRLRRAQLGGGAAAGRVTRGAGAWSVPWLFGRGPARAVAWRKTGALLRKAKGTLLISVLVLIFVTVLSVLLPQAQSDSLTAPLLVAILGTFYMCAGLRFDFRDDFERMESIKAWPVAPRRLFFAMLVPEVLFVSVLLSLAVLLRALMSQSFDPQVFGIVALLPFLVFGWVALDNAVFLFSPVRMVAGQEGALQNAGRGTVLMLLRVALISLGGAIAAGAALGTHYAATNWLGASEALALWLAFGAIGSVALVADLLLIGIGGALLARFDLARDRG